LPKDQREKLKEQEYIVKKVCEERGWNNSNAVGKWMYMYMKAYGGPCKNYYDARSMWIREHCKAKGIPCDKFVADEIAGVHTWENTCRRINDEQKYGYAYVRRNNYLYL